MGHTSKYETARTAMHEHIWRGKAISSGCENLEDLLASLKAEVDYVQTLIDLGVKADFSNAEDDYIFLQFTDKQLKQVQPPFAERKLIQDLPTDKLLELAKNLGIDLNALVKDKKTGQTFQVKDPNFEPALRRIIASLIQDRG